MQPQRTHRNSRPVWWLGAAVIALAGLSQYQPLADAYVLATYQPTTEVAGFESRVTLTRAAQVDLYGSKPQFDAKTAFNTDCNTQPHELELGCYYRGRIYVLKIDNASLASEMDVVSAHELLHAAWAKMSPSERSQLTPELERVYATINDPDLKTRMAGYATSEPGEEANELHSILGTEYASLSPALEAHYAKFFVDRQQVLKAHASYQAVFDTRRQELERELALIRTEKGQLSTLNRQLDAYRSNGQIQTYNSMVPKQNSLVDQINSQIADYQNGVDEYNALSKSLDSQEITETESPAQ